MALRCVKFVVFWLRVFVVVASGLLLLHIFVCFLGILIVASLLVMNLFFLMVLVFSLMALVSFAVNTVLVARLLFMAAPIPDAIGNVDASHVPSIIIRYLASICPTTELVLVLPMSMAFAHGIASVMFNMV